MTPKNTSADAQIDKKLLKVLMNCKGGDLSRLMQGRPSLTEEIPAILKILTSELDAFLHAQPAQEWMDIESAPKGGKSILVWDCVDEEAYSVWWNDDWQIAPDVFVPEKDATHWRPLPAAPEED